MSDEPNCCVCGHDRDDHGPTPEFPGAMICRDDDCGCEAFDAEDSDEQRN